MISKQKLDALDQRLLKLNITSDDLTIKAILGSGPGGQHVNKSSTTIYVKHHPTGIEVKYGQERSKTLNQYRALHILCDKIEEHIEGIRSKKAAEVAKLRKQKKRRSRRQQQKLIEEKREHSHKKELRKEPDLESA